MKKYVLFLALAASSANASHWLECDVSAKVISVENLARLNGTATFARMNSTIVKPDHEQVATVKVLEVVNDSGTSKCHFNADQEMKLLIQKEEVGQFAPDSTLNLHYQNRGDRAGSMVTWEVK